MHTNESTKGKALFAERRIAYLLSQYPAVSHTFFLSEIAAMRERGFTIETASINGIAPPEDGFSETEMAEHARTFYVKLASKGWVLRQLLGIALSHPGVVLRGLREALELAKWDLHGLIYGLFYLAEALLVGDWMRAKGCTHLHVHFSGPVATVGMLCSVAWGVPYSLTVHGPDEFYDVEKFYLMRKIERANFVICISDFCRSQLLRLVSPAIWGKFRVCRLGVDESVFTPRDENESDGQAGVTRLLCVGRLHPSKGQPVLVMAVDRLKRQGFRIRLDLVGGGVDRESLEALVAEKGLEAEVTLHGAASHELTRSFLRAADIFVLASFAEGVPVALMEAMAMRIVCVSTYVAGIPELIEPEKSGVLVAPSSVDELTEAIAGLIREPGRRQALAAGGRAKVLEQYNLAKNADRLAEVFREMLGMERVR